MAFRPGARRPMILSLIQGTESPPPSFLFLPLLKESGLIPGYLLAAGKMVS